MESSLVNPLRSLLRKMGLTLLFISHNIALLRNMAQQAVQPLSAEAEFRANTTFAAEAVDGRSRIGIP